MSKETAYERIERLKREQEAATANEVRADESDMIDQLAHEDDGAPDFAELAKKLEERKAAEEKPSALENTVKFTIYVDENVANAFKALCTERGDQRKFATQAFADFVSKKVKELGL